MSEEQDSQLDSDLPVPNTAEALARDFHETYERLAPDFGYKTREASAKPWSDVPEQNKRLMVAVADEILSRHVDPLQERISPTVETPKVEVNRHTFHYWLSESAVSLRNFAKICFPTRKELREKARALDELCTILSDPMKIIEGLVYDRDRWQKAFAYTQDELKLTEKALNDATDSVLDLAKGQDRLITILEKVARQEPEAITEVAKVLAEVTAIDNDVAGPIHDKA